jgi:hypothetical protein
MAIQQLSGTSAKDVQVILGELNLQTLLPSHYKLELNAKTRLASILSIEAPCILAQQQFTKNEWAIFMALLISLPHYAPYEILLASVTLLSSADCRKRLQEAQELGPKILKLELKPVHRALSGVRTKLVNLFPELKVSLIRNLGYALTISPPSSRESSDAET